MTREGEFAMRTFATGSSLARRCAALLAGLAIVTGPRPAPALTPAPDLPSGTFHELRITSLTALTVAQQITQPAVCSNGNACLHDEIRIGVSIDFEAGRIAIDARAPEDESGTPVPPAMAGAILFNTQSGPAELRFAPPCENPDGCVGGEALYIGTIDQGGNVAFPSLGLDFELFGVSPISRFRAPMGTGPSTDPADPGVIAQGEPLDFATGALHLAGVDFIPAPIVGTTLQLNRIRGTLSPVPIPPVEVDDLLRCQTAITKSAAKFVKTKQLTVQKCVERLLACAIDQETGSGAPQCLPEASEMCNSMLARAIRSEEGLSRKIVDGCRDVGPANVVAIAGGLGFSLDKPQCDRFGIGMATREDIALCLGRALSCQTEEIIGRLEPRAFEMLASNGYATLLPPQGCIPAIADGDATAQNGEALRACQTAIGKQGARYVKTKHAELQACLAANLSCHLPFELPGGSLDPSCVAAATARCNTALDKIAAAGAKRDLVVQRRCVALDAPSIPALAQGLGFSGLAPICQALTPAGSLANLGGLMDCLERSIDCSIDGMARSMVPRGHEVLHHHALEDVIDANPCVHPECGDAILDPGEDCDPLLDPDQTCNADCTLVECGDGLTQGTEECDDANTSSGDGCSATCTDEPAACGNGVIEHFAGEVCDDSDSAAGDGCGSTCQSNETCGNGFVDTIRGEQCDDGGTDYVATLDGGQETPPVVTGASGSATLVLNGDDTLTYNVTTTGLTGTMAHIHLGAAGTPGPIIINLVGGPADWAGTTAPLTAEQKAQLNAGLLYINVHTAANINGEIRGQIGFAATASGDGCSADCRSDETCGNGVIDAVTGEACDDGGGAAGDGCDASCQFEVCSFASGPALGTRTFSVAPATSRIFNSILGLGNPVGSISAPPMSLTAGATDAGGSATVTLDADVIVTVDVTLGSQTQCFKFLAGSTGSLHCCGGHAVGMSNTRDSNTGGVPATGGQSNGPAVVLSGVDGGGIGDLLMAFQVQQAGGPAGFDCSTATYGGTSTQFWTTGTANGRVLRPAQGGATLEFIGTGEPFDCAMWTSEDGPGTFVSADTALNAIPGVDAANVRSLDD
jgi:cysteine-rich repeat protein